MFGRSSDRTSGQKWRYLSAALLGILLLSAVAASAWYLLIYTQKEIAVIEVSFSGQALPLSQGLQREIDRLKGMTIAEVRDEEITQLLLEFPEIDDLSMQITYPDRLQLTLRARRPIVLLRLQESGFYFLQNAEGEEVVISDLVVTEDGTVIPAYRELAAAAAASVPVVEIAGREDAFSDREVLDIRLAAFIRMLQAGMESEMDQYALIERIFFNVQGNRELAFTYRSPEVALACIVPEPVEGSRFPGVLKAAAAAAAASGMQGQIRMTLMSDHAVLLSSN